MKFADRREAGRRLGSELGAYRDRDALVLGLARGGVPVAFEVAEALEASLETLVVRKVGTPGQEELASGAVTSEVTVYNDDLLRTLGRTRSDLKERVDAEKREVGERIDRYRDGRARPRIEGRTVILVDDGVATGATMRAAVQAVRQRGAERVVVAVPVCAAAAVDRLRQEADDLVTLEEPREFIAVGFWYRSFPQTDDGEVRSLLEEAWGGGREPGRLDEPASGTPPRESRQDAVDEQGSSAPC